MKIKPNRLLPAAGILHLSWLLSSAICWGKKFSQVLFSNIKIKQVKKLLLLGVLFISCKKEAGNESKTAITVIDKISGTPVAGATLVLYRCGNWGCLLSSTTVFSGKTDNNGIVNVPAAAYKDISNELNVVRPDYLPFEVQRGTTLLLSPMGWLRFRIVKTGNYPPGSRIGISNQFNAYDLLVNAAADSIVVMYGGGGVTNNVLWQVIDEQGQELNHGGGTVQVARLDTTNVLLNY